MYKWHFLILARNAHKSPRLNLGVFNYPKAENRAINGVLNVINGGLEGLIKNFLHRFKNILSFWEREG